MGVWGKAFFFVFLHLKKGEKKIKAINAFRQVKSSSLCRLQWESAKNVVNCRFCGERDTVGFAGSEIQSARKPCPMVVTDFNPEVSARKPCSMVVTDVNPEVSKDESEVQSARKPFPIVVTDVNPDVSKDDSEVQSARKPCSMVVTDVNPEVSMDESEVHPWRKRDPIYVIFGAWIEHNTTCLQPSKKYPPSRGPSARGERGPRWP